ncbi:MAG: putative LPS assembly protein LptD [Chitinophagales bacterium]
MRIYIYIFYLLFFSALLQPWQVCNAEFVHFIEQQTQFPVDSPELVDPDTLAVDSLYTDTVFTGNKSWYVISEDSLDAIINYSGVDSIVYDIDSGITYIYLNGVIDYQTFHLEADYIEFNWEEKLLIAKRVIDTSDTAMEKPYFEDGGDGFAGDTLLYDFDSKKGKIYNFSRQEGEGFVTAEVAKKGSDESYFGSGLKYTTCNLDHPHFYIGAEKAKIVPQKIAVTGPAELVIADVPTPLFLPFGIFPIKQGQTSGIMIPTYGYNFSRGYFLMNGGYYFALGDHLDLALTGDIYTNSSWRLNAYSRYAAKYKYNGNISLNYAVNKNGLEFTPGYNPTKDFFIRWSHSQDSKAKPGTSFSASVNAGTSDYLINNSYNSSYLNNSLSSSITYGKVFTGTPFSLTSSLRHDQNTSTGIVNLTLPDVALNMNRIYPFKNVIENNNNPLAQFGINYDLSARNSISSPDSTLFERESLEKFKNGIAQGFSASMPVKFFKYFTFTPSFNYDENWFFQTIRKTYDLDTLITSGIDPITGEIVFDTSFTTIDIDTVRGFEAARFYSMNAGISTKLYATAQFNGRIKAIRQTFTPSINFTYRPDFGDVTKYPYYKEYYPGNQQDLVKYSVFEGGVYAAPPNGQVGSIGLNLSSNLEMKIASQKDTITGEKKVKLIENMSIGSSYNFAADSLNLSDMSFSAYTTLFEKVRINVSGSFDPYVLDSLGRNINQFEWDVNKRLGRLNSANMSLSTSLRSKRNENSEMRTNYGTPEEQQMVWDNPDYYIDFEVPWSFNTGYNLRITNTLSANGTDSLYTTQTLTFGGDINLTPNWKIQANSGFDFELKEFSYTSVNIYRNLHCWEMSFSWIPFGIRQSYVFNINVKSQVLQDLKLTRKKDWTEY